MSPVIEGVFSGGSLYKWRDECSPIRHFLARLGFCRHKGTWIKTATFHEGLRELFEETLARCELDPEGHPSKFPRIFNIEEEDES